MKKILLTIINITSALTFFFGALLVEGGCYLAGALAMGICLAWMWAFAYANGS